MEYLRWRVTVTMVKEPSPQDAHRSASVLRVADLEVRYSNGARGVKSFELAAAPGEIVALLGRNGAGKTSALRGMTGALRSERIVIRGSVWLGDEQVCGKPPMNTFKRGLVLVQERQKVFAALTVDEHLDLVACRGTPARTPCFFEPLDRRRSSKAGFLSGGERQMLALEVAFRSKPKVLLIDELSLGLAPILVSQLMGRLRELARSEQIATVIVEQDAPAALAVADRLCILRDGTVAWSGLSSDVDRESLISHYVG
jgi:branched-chain amino acid transport system ATP-binding protein